MTVSTSQASFLGNARNKSRLIESLSQHLKRQGINVKQSAADADVLIVNTAIDLSKTEDLIAVVGQDTDLLVLLVVLNFTDKDVVFVKHGQKQKPVKVYSSKKLQAKLGDMCQVLLFMHAMSGCDKTSVLYRQFKEKTFKLLMQNDELHEVVAVFNNSA